MWPVLVPVELVDVTDLWILVFDKAGEDEAADAESCHRGEEKKVTEPPSKASTPGPRPEQKTPVPKGRGMIDDFRLAGSRTWGRIGGHLTNRGTGWRTNMAEILRPTTPFSQRAAPAPLWLEIFTKRHIRRGTKSTFRVRYE